jgi:hypothetical protein
MVKYTRRHFQDIARLISEIPKARRKVEARKYCKLFREDNPRFDEDKFLKACGL